jgi:U3 small nucleolar RNA-associated protein 21
MAITYLISYFHACRFTEQPALRNAVASSVCLTQCGNFIIIGTSTGHLDRFNMQSGLHRCEYTLPQNKTAHAGAVRGIVADGLNQLVVSGGADEYVRFWNFKDGKTIGRLPMSAAVAFFATNRLEFCLDVRE